MMDPCVDDMSSQPQTEQNHTDWSEEDWAWSSFGMVVEAIHELNPTPAVVQGSSEAPSGMRSAPGSTRSIETGVRSIYSTDELGTGRSLGPASARNAGRSTCQGDNCGADLTGMRAYNQRYKACQTCLKLPVVAVKGKEVRFCQQCSCFHDITAFDGKKRSCRKKLEEHNRKRWNKKKPEEAEEKARNGCRDQVIGPDFKIEPNWMMPSGSPSNKPPSPSPSPGSGVFTRVVNNVINNVANMFGSHQTDQPDEGPCNDAVVKGIQDTAARISLSEAQGSVQQPSTPIQVTELQFDAGAQGHVSLPTLDARMEHGNFASPVTHYPQNMSVDMSDADFSVLAQLVPSESYFAVTRSEYPILAGQSAPTGSYNQMSLDSARVQVSSASTPAKTNGGFHGQVQEVCNATPAKPVHATSYAPKSRLGELDICLRDAIPHRAGPKFRQLDSFTDWIPRTVPDVHIHDQPAMAPELRAELPLQPSLPLIASLESFWDRFGDDPMQHVVEQTAAIPMEEAASATKIAPPLAIANARNTPVRKPALNIVLGEDVNDPDSLFLDSEVSLQDHMLQDVVYIMDDPASNTYIPPTDHMIRLSVKMYDKTPDKLTLDMRDKVETLFPNCHLVDGYLQKGCTHLVVDLSIPSGYASALVHPQGLAKALKGGPLATELPEDHFLSGQGVIQGPGGTAVRVSSGRIVAEASARRAAPFLLGANTPVVCSDGNCDCGSTSVTLYAVHDTSSAPISRLSVAVRQAGSFIDASLEEAASLCAAPAFGPEAVIVRLRVRLSCDDLAEGLVLIEVSNAGVLSDPLPIVSTSDALIVKELAALGHAKPLTSSEPSLDARLVADLGLILDGFASANLARGALARYGEGSEALASHKARMASRSRSVLLSAAERGWVAVAAAVLEAADADCQTVTEAVTKVDALRPNGPGLLHAAIRGRNPVLLSLILDWAAESGCVLDVTSPWGGVSPLHLSAAMDDGGGMAELLLQHAAPGDLETQRMLWGDTNGRHLSPEAVAKRCSRQTTVSGMALKRPLVGGGESAAAAERQTASRSAMRPPLAPPLPSRPDREASSKISDSPQGNLLAKARNMWNTGRKQFVDRRHSSPTLDKLDSAKSYMDLSDQGEPSPPPGLDEQVPWEEVETLGLDASAESFVAPLPAMNDVPRSPCVPRTDSARDESANYPPPKVGDSGSVTGPEVCDSMRQGKQQLGIPKPLGDRM